MSDYDLVLLNGRVVDPESLFDAVSNVGIKGDRIMAITNEAISGKETLDVTGLVVAPGFIDTHHHWIHPMGAKLALRDGRTTILDLEWGAFGTTIDKWYKSREGNFRCNYGMASSHEAARAIVLDGFTPEHGDCLDGIKSRANSGWTATKPTLEQGNEILKVLDAGLQAGGIGCASTVGYMREGVSAREIYEMTKLAAAYGRTTAMHFRGTPGTEVAEVNGIQELLANAAALGAPAIACHFNNPGYNLVHELIVNMQKRGMNVWGELYPYSSGCTALNAVFLEEEVWVKQLGHRYEDTIADAVTGEFYTKESRDEMLKKEPVRMVVVYKMPDEAILDWLRLPGVAIATDSMPCVTAPFMTEDVDIPLEEMPTGHPRGAGSCGKTLRLGREHGIPLMHQITSLSYTPAKHLGMTGLKAMQQRGRLQVGMIADITVFDPKTVTDKATFLKGTAPTEGIPYVLVSGKFAVKDSDIVKDSLNGQPIRYEPCESRLEPIDEDKWKHVYTVTKVDFGGTDPSQTFSCCGHA